MSAEAHDVKTGFINGHTAECDVLVVEDDRGIRTMIVEALSDEGYAVSAAVHGRDALEFLDGSIPRLILLDIMMPIMDGATFYRHLRSDMRFRTIPIIAMSAANNLQQLDGSEQIVELLPKPFMLTRLLQLIGDHLGLNAGFE